jgi:hypothetical protein
MLLRHCLLAVVDFLFFSGVLIYQMVPKPGQAPMTSFRDRGASQGSHESSIPVTWWINIPGIKLEDIIFSMVLDLLGVIGKCPWHCRNNHGREWDRSHFAALLWFPGNCKETTMSYVPIDWASMAR